MAKYRMVRTDFWTNPMVSEELTPEDKYFYLYLLTNPQTTQIGIYKITKKQMAFDMGYSIESIHSLMDRFILHHKLIRYNPETRELAIKNWGKDNLHKGGKPIMDCICSELKEVEDLSLIQYVAESIRKQEIRSLYQSFCNQEEMFGGTGCSEQDETELNIMKEDKKDDTFPCRSAIRGQKEKEKQKEKENKKEKQQQEAFNPSIENNPGTEASLQINPETEDVKEILDFWDASGFGVMNVNAKQQLLSWLNDSSFLQPKEVILKALQIACTNNKRRLNDIIAILKNWENESLRTVEEIDSYCGTLKPAQKSRPSYATGRSIPGEFILDLTAGEEC